MKRRGKGVAEYAELHKVARTEEIRRRRRDRSGAVTAILELEPTTSTSIGSEEATSNQTPMGSALGDPRLLELSEYLTQVGSQQLGAAYQDSELDDDESDGAGSEPVEAWCLVDEIGSKLDRRFMVRALALMWAIPGLLMLAAGLAWSIGFLDTGGLERYIVASRIATVVLTPLTLVVSAMWIVRSWESLPSVSALEQTGLAASGHLAMASVAAGSAILASAATGGMSVWFWTVTATTACGATMIIPRWVAMARRASSRPQSFLVPLQVVALTELSVGWIAWPFLADGSLGMAVTTFIVRGLVLTLVGLGCAGALGSATLNQLRLDFGAKRWVGVNESRRSAT